MGWQRIREYSLTRYGDTSTTLVQAKTPDDGVAVIWTKQTYFAGLGLTATGPAQLYLGYFGPDGAERTVRLVDDDVGNRNSVRSLDIGTKGEALVTWVEPPHRAQTSTDTFARLYNSEGTSISSAIKLNRAPNASVPDADAALLTKGAVVVWTDTVTDLLDRSGSSIRMKMISDSGVVSPKTTLVNSVTSGNQTNPDVYALHGGGFVVSWSHHGNYRAQIFDATGRKVGKEIALKLSAAQTNEPDINSYGLRGFSVDRTLPDGSPVQDRYNAFGQLIATVALAKPDTSDTRDFALDFPADSVEAQILDWQGQPNGQPISLPRGPIQATGAFSGLLMFDDVVGLLRYRSTQQGLNSVPISEHMMTLFDLTHYIGDATPERVTGSDRNDRLFGNGGGDVISGLDGDDTIDGGEGDDLLNGGVGNDEIRTGTGRDSVNAGAGHDRIVVESVQVVVDAGTGDDLIELFGFGSIGNGPSIPVAGATPVPRMANLQGGPGFDTLILRGAQDAIHDLTAIEISGFESLSLFTDGDPSGDGTVTIIRLRASQFGKDGTSNTIVATEQPKDGTSNTIVATEEQNDGFSITILLGGLDQDGATEMLVIDLADRRDFDMRGWSFRDWGGQGEEIHLLGSALDNVIDASSWRDIVRGGDGNDRVRGGGRDDQIFGEGGNDWLAGNAGDDLVAGGVGFDLLFGGAGNDRLNGGPGRDILRGGQGADVFVFAHPDGGDRIADFTPGEDRIDLSRLAPNLVYAAGPAFSGTGPSLRHDARIGQLQADLDGDGRMDWWVDIGDTAPQAADLLL